MYGLLRHFKRICLGGTIVERSLIAALIVTIVIAVLVPFGKTCQAGVEPAVEANSAAIVRCR